MQNVKVFGYNPVCLGVWRGEGRRCRPEGRRDSSSGERMVQADRSMVRAARQEVAEAAPDNNHDSVAAGVTAGCPAIRRGNARLDIQKFFWSLPRFYKMLRICLCALLRERQEFSWCPVREALETGMHTRHLISRLTKRTRLDTIFAHHRAGSIPIAYAQTLSQLWPPAIQISLL